MSKVYVTVALGMCLCAPMAMGTTYYVAQNDPGASDLNLGTEGAPWKTISKANSMLVAGDTVIIKVGTYNEKIWPVNSGAPGQYITYLRYQTDLVKLSGGVEPGIYLWFKDYIIVDGITTDGVNKHAWLISSDHNIIKNCHMDYCTSSGGARSGLYLDDSHYNKILGNLIEYSGSLGGDSLVLRRSDHNLVAGNSIIYANHACFALRGASYNIIRDNYFTNPVQKIGEVYDICELGLGIMTERNVFQDNTFDYVPPFPGSNSYSGIQYAGQDSIIRRNLFYGMDGVGISAGLWDGSQCPPAAPPEASRNYGNRIYHNVFYNNGRSGVWIAGIPGFTHTYADNIYKNNILFANYDGANPLQIKAGRLTGYYFERNNIIGQTPGQDVITCSALGVPTHDLTWWQLHYPSLYGGNIELAPQFVDAGSNDFHLSPSSPMIDAGTYLTQGFDTGVGTLFVLDPSSFCDGYDIEGEGGDWIRLEGSNQIAQIVDVDYASNTLTLDRDVTCDPFQGITLLYEGSAPDLGAFEYSAPTATVAGRYVFYNNCYFDGNDPAANVADDGAIATDKTPLLPGGTGAFINYTAYWRGINGLMVDIDGLPGTPTGSDFTFKVGNDSNPAGWSAAPAPSDITVRAGDGAGGSDRITIIWSDNVIEKQWLQVTVLATANTGLGAPDVFYFGNAIGETGNSPADADVTPTDEIEVRGNPHTLSDNPAGITETCDFNHDRKVTPTDQVICRNNGTSGPTALQLITVP